MVSHVRILFPVILVGIAVIWLSNASGAGSAQGADRTGSPIGIGTCGSCHDGGNYAPTMNITLLEGDQLVSRYIPGKQYQVKVTLEGKNNPKEYGFQLVALGGANHQQAGIFGQAPAGFRQIILDNRRYIEQSSPRPSNTFIIPWTAPMAGTGNVRFYAAGLITNDNGGTGGDSPIHLTTPLTIGEAMSSFVSNIPMLKGEVIISPNPINSMLQVCGNALPEGKLKIRVIDVFGRLQYQSDIFSDESEMRINIAANDWFPGVYFLNITDDKAVRTISFIKN
jgi:hypothetical protein